MIALKSLPICHLNVTSPKEHYMIDKHKKFQLFAFSTLPIVLMLSVRFACHRVCTGVNELLVAHISMGTFVHTQIKIPFKKGCVWSRGIFRYQWVGLRIVHCLVSILRN